MSVRSFLRRARYLSLPACLFATLCLGGAASPELSPRIWLSVLSIVTVIPLLPFALRQSETPKAKFLLLIIFVWSAWSILQLVPLPEAIWSKLGDRSVIEEGLTILSLPANHPMPISLAPESGRISLSGATPFLAVFCLVLVLGRRSASTLNWIIPAMGAATALLGFAQILSNNDLRLYFYEVTNPNSPVGIFANANHQACFLALSLPFTAALLRDMKRSWLSRDVDVAKAISVLAMALPILLCLLAAGSVAGYLLLLPALAGSFMIFNGRASLSPSMIRFSLLAGVLVMMSGVLVFSSPLLGGLSLMSLSGPEMSRPHIWSTTLQIIRDHWLFGTGLGSFEDVFRIYEDPDSVTRTYANNAHNDVFQFVMETGLVGAILIIVGLRLYWQLFKKAWKQESDEIRHTSRAATIALLIIMLHSLVDYPARTPAIACIAAACLALLVQDQGRKKRSNRGRDQSESDDRSLVI